MKMTKKQMEKKKNGIKAGTVRKSRIEDDENYRK